MPSTATDDRGAEYLERARAFVPEPAAAPAIEWQRESPEPVVVTMVEHGFFRMLLPRLLGGAELRLHSCPSFDRM
jgi:alkylation response protein AidB-like acyl-CoA dehydrogenase